MKNDPSFKLVAAIIFAGVLIAFISPAPSVDNTVTAATESAPATGHSE